MNQFLNNPFFWALISMFTLVGACSVVGSRKIGSHPVLGWIIVSILSLALLALGLVIWYFKKESGTSLQDILFYVAAVPIVLFSMGQLGNFFGRGGPSYQLSRSVSSQSSNQRTLQDVRDIKTRVKSGLNWLMAGLLVWLYSYFM